MYLDLIDGIVRFAKYFVYFSLGEYDYIIDNKLKPFQKEPEGIVCYSLEELNNVKQILTDLNISYFINELQVSNDAILKTKGFKYSSRSEAIEHINGEIEEPESEIIPKLKREKAELEMAIASILGGGV